jgi:hypothetical protein
MRHRRVWVGLAALALACSSQAPAPSSGSGATTSCAQWQKFSREQQTYAMSQFVARSLPPSLTDKARACMNGITDQIADHATGLCKRDGGDLSPAATTAISTALDFCQQKPGSS